MADVSFGDSSDDEDGDFDDGASATSRSSRLSRESRMTDMESRFRGSFFFAAAGIARPAAKAMAVVAIRALLSLDI